MISLTRSPALVENGPRHVQLRHVALLGLLETHAAHVHVGLDDGPRAVRRQVDVVHHHAHRYSGQRKKRNQGLGELPVAPRHGRLARHGLGRLRQLLLVGSEVAPRACARAARNGRAGAPRSCGTCRRASRSRARRPARSRAGCRAGSGRGPADRSFEFMTSSPPVSAASAFIPSRRASMLRRCRLSRTPGAVMTGGPSKLASPPGTSDTRPRVSRA